ncbi:hypothetical protein ACQBAT_07775 [Ornithinimicrobium sp. Y1847]|uniref:hypothetical protein n=1 Tax=unclassified Ornithinimicrobium TaxID=2615080 RepID=UPI003B6730F4
MTPSPLPPVAFLHVVGHRARRPGVLAIVERTFRVRWQRGEWTCDCPAPDGATCEHVDSVLALLHPNVLGSEDDR